MASKRGRKFLKIGALVAGLGAAAVGGGAIAGAMSKVSAKRKELKAITKAVDVKKVISLKGSDATLATKGTNAESTMAAGKPKIPTMYLIIGGVAVLAIAYFAMRK